MKRLASVLLAGSWVPLAAGADLHGPTRFLDDVSVRSWTAISNLSYQAVGGGVWTNGAVTNYYRLCATNLKGRLPLSTNLVVPLSGASTASAARIRWTPVQGVSRIVVERSPDGSSWTNYLLLPPLLSSWTDFGTDSWLNGTVAGVSLIPDPSVPWGSAAELKATRSALDARLNATDAALLTLGTANVLNGLVFGQSYGQGVTWALGDTNDWGVCTNATSATNYLQTTPPINDAPAAVAHYGCNDNAAGYDVDDSLNHYEGIANEQSSAMHVAGKIDGALSVAAGHRFHNGDYVLPQTGPITIALWVSADTPGYNGYAGSIVVALGNGGGGCGLGLNYDKWQAYSYYYPGGYSFTEAADSISTGAWYHVACVWDGTYQTLYVNGAPVASNTYWGSFYSGQWMIVVGDCQWENSYYPFGGQVDDVRVYENALTADQVAALYNSGGGTEAELSITDTPLWFETTAWQWPMGYGATNVFLCLGLTNSTPDTNLLVSVATTDPALWQSCPITNKIGAVKLNSTLVNLWGCDIAGTNVPEGSTFKVRITTTNGVNTRIYSASVAGR